MVRGEIKWVHQTGWFEEGRQGWVIAPDLPFMHQVGEAVALLPCDAWHESVGLVCKPRHTTTRISHRCRVTNIPDCTQMGSSFPLMLRNHEEKYVSLRNIYKWNDMAFWTSAGNNNDGNRDILQQCQSHEGKRPYRTVPFREGLRQVTT